MKALSKNIAGRDSRKIPANRLLRRFHDLLEYLDDILVEIDREGRVLYITPNVEKFLGYKSEEIVGKLPTEFMPPEEAAERYSLFLELASSGQKLTFMEMTYLHKEGRRFRVEANAAPYFGSKGQLLGYIGVVRDITGRKRMEEELRANQRDLNHAQAVAHTGSWRLNVRQNKLLWSNETHRIFGIPEGTHMDYETFLSAVHPEDREHVDRCWKAALDGVPYDIEHRIIVGGTFKWVRERAELELDPEGVLLGGFGTVQDITDRKQMEEALRESEEKFRSAFDKGAVPMAITGLDSRIVLANSAFSRMLGYSESELAGMSFYEFTHPDDIQANLAGLAPVMTGGQDSFRMEKRYIRKDGRVVWVDMSTASARGSNGEPLYIVTHAQDITDRKEAEEKLRRSESLYRRMALRLEQVREEERAALARELHDEMGQLLAGLRIDLSWLRKRLPKENKELIEKADAMQEYLLPLIKKVRRLYTELRPALLDEVGLIAAIEAHLHDFHQRTGIIARLETHLRHTSLGNPGENQKARRRV